MQKILIQRIINFGWQNFKRQKPLALATTSVLILSTTLISGLFLFHGISGKVIDLLKERADLSIYFLTEVSEQEILKIKEDLSQFPEIKSIKYVSREEALERFIERHKKTPFLMEALSEVGENPLQASLNVKTFQAHQYAAVASFLENAPFKNLIDKVNLYQNQRIIEKIFSISSTLKRIGILLSLILAAITILVVFSLIRLSIFASREEISIMKLVGAPNLAIKGPFLVQGAIAGILATFFAFLLTFLFCFTFSSKVSIVFPGFNLFGFFLSNLWLIFLFQLFSGVGLGILSSLFAIRKYLEQ